MSCMVSSVPIHSTFKASGCVEEEAYFCASFSSSIPSVRLGISDALLRCRIGFTGHLIWVSSPLIAIGTLELEGWLFSRADVATGAFLGPMPCPSQGRRVCPPQSMNVPPSNLGFSL